MNRRIHLEIRTLLVALLCLGFQSTSHGDDLVTGWSQFRGPQGNGVASKAHPTQWNDDLNLAWSTEIAGGGWSSPVASGGRVFLTTAVSSDDTRPTGFGEGVSSMRSFFQSKPPEEPFSFEVHCIDLADGSLLWTKQIVARTPPHKIHPSNSYATESPVTDGQQVYAYFGAVGVVACLDLAGKVIWQRDIGAYRTSSDFKTRRV